MSLPTTSHRPDNIRSKRASHLLRWFSVLFFVFIIVFSLQCLSYRRTYIHQSMGTTQVTLQTEDYKQVLLWSNTQAVLNSLRPDERSRHFATRADKFFSQSCNTRFFMTWISQSKGLGPREMLSIESVFKTHPDACLLIVTNMPTHVNSLLEPLTARGFRMEAMYSDLEYLLQGTPAERWYQQLLLGHVNPGAISIQQNLSNLLRLALLYRYGGVYIDIDVIVLKSMSTLRNVVGVQSYEFRRRGFRVILNNAVLVFDQRHSMVYKFIEEFAQTFNGDKWGFNGPDLVTRVVKREGKFGLNVLGLQAFYPRDWNTIQRLYKKPRFRSELVIMKGELERIGQTTYTVHLWNKVTKDIEVQKGSLIARLMLDSCVLCDSLELADVKS